MVKYKKSFVAFMVLSLCFSLLTSCFYFKSDEELIESRIDRFLDAYNSGDMDEVLECLDSKTKNTFKASAAFGNALIGKTGFDYTLSDLFSLSIGVVSEDDILTVSDISISMVSDDKATVDVTLSYKDKLSDIQEKAVFTMVKEDGDWFIKNLENK